MFRDIETIPIILNCAVKWICMLLDAFLNRMAVAFIFLYFQQIIYIYLFFPLISQQINSGYLKFN